MAIEPISVSQLLCFLIGQIVVAFALFGGVLWKFYTVVDKTFDTRISDLKNGIKEDLSKVEKRIDKVEQRLDELGQKVDKLEEKVNSIDKEVHVFAVFLKPTIEKRAEKLLDKDD